MPSCKKLLDWGHPAVSKFANQNKEFNVMTLFCCLSVVKCYYLFLASSQTWQNLYCSTAKSIKEQIQ